MGALNIVQIPAASEMYWVVTKISNKFRFVGGETIKINC